MKVKVFVKVKIFKYFIPLECHPSCLTCLGDSLTDCASCDDNLKRSFLTTFACSCQLGYYDLPNTPLCESIYKEPFSYT
jgi:hypothetical protein